MILVVGGTGRLGRLVVTDLLARDLPVRILTRNLTTGGEPRQGVERVTGDIRHPADIARAMEGVEVVVSAVQGFAGKGRASPASVDRQGNINLIDAAAHRHAHVVLMSVIGASPDHPMDLFRAKWAAEQHLQAAGTPWTIVRSSAFVETWAELLQRAPVFGKGDNPINFVSVLDVAAAVQLAATDPTVRNRIIEVAGPENVTLNDLAARIRPVGGESRRVRHVPRVVLRAMAPLSRLPRAGLIMDTADFTHGPPAGTDVVAVPTDIATALARL